MTVHANDVNTDAGAGGGDAGGGDSASESATRAMRNMNETNVPPIAIYMRGERQTDMEQRILLGQQDSTEGGGGGVDVPVDEEENKAEGGLYL